jgi:protein-L-isoaspartate(D-aspartate) O-methyltransferase
MSATIKEISRDNAIKEQIRPWGGLNNNANEALEKMPREFFVPDEFSTLAFTDINIPLTDKASMLHPKVEGRILDALDITKTQKVLEIGTGSGYLTAVLATLASNVTTVEIDESLSNSAQEKLTKLNIKNVNFIIADASKSVHTPDTFDTIIVSCAIPQIDKNYFDLLNLGGRIFIFESKGQYAQAKIITRISETKWQTKTLFDTQLELMQGLEKKESFKF